MRQELITLRNTIAIWTLLGFAISILAMFLLEPPGEICFNNNYFSEYWVEVILLINAIAWGIALWVWDIRNYWRQRKGVEEDEMEL